MQRINIYFWALCWWLRPPFFLFVYFVASLPPVRATTIQINPFPIIATHCQIPQISTIQHLIFPSTFSQFLPSSPNSPQIHLFIHQKKKGSTTAPAGSLAPHSGDMPADLPLDSPIIDPRSSPPNRLNLFQQDTMVTNGGPLTKHSHTEQVMMMHTLKTKLQKYQAKCLLPLLFHFLCF